MHVIMNARRLFVSVPSAGNIGHFEFSIFNALVSPFGPLLPRCTPASALLFLPFLLLRRRFPPSLGFACTKQRRAHSRVLHAENYDLSLWGNYLEFGRRSGSAKRCKRRLPRWNSTTKVKVYLGADGRFAIDKIASSKCMYIDTVQVQFSVLHATIFRICS